MRVEIIYGKLSVKSIPLKKHETSTPKIGTNCPVELRETMRGFSQKRE